MKRLALRALMTLAILCTPPAAVADQTETQLGQDRFVAGGRVEQTDTISGDLLIAGARTRVSGTVAEDLYASAFSVDIPARVAGDIVAAGGQVVLSGAAGRDALLAGMSITVDTDASVNGSLRVFAGSATLRGTIGGTLFVSAGEVHLDGPVSGDVLINAADVTFGSDARIDGTLMLSTPQQVAVPTEVVPAGRITYVDFDAENWPDLDEMGWEGLPEGPSTFAIIGGYLVTLGFLLALGATFLALVPQRVAVMRRMALNRPWLTVLLGAIGFSTLVGLIPISAMSVIGIPLVPIALLGVVLGWVLGYLLGAYVIAMALARAGGLGDTPSLPARIAVLAGAITGAALLNFIPVIGWVANFAIVFFGVGALTEGVLRAAMPGVDPDEHDEMMEPKEGRPA
ncbi:hypothetical protein [Pontivivens ytuae]|uniref:Polymer-forming cytoskeletal protein n=1 Tax=Pontivivens ytuae TaxID=2789856 RepID=A0A7S9LS67_9RHOB|nr:hypothetical protein [Pontivivens ytuae]QPH54109.1 hypothetical protein I0K15_20445 [Pontivivens ytuae]